MPDSSKSFPEKEEMERSFQKLSKDLKETQHERDKALQQLTRLKQHLLEKVSFFVLLFCSLFCFVLFFCILFFPKDELIMTE